MDQIKSWRKGLNLLGLRQVTYDKTRHFHGLVFRKPSLRLQELTKKDVIDMSDSNVEDRDIKTMFFIPQDFTKRDECESDTKIDVELNRDFIIEDFMELPNIEL